MQCGLAVRVQGRDAVVGAIGRVQSGQPAASEAQLMLLRSLDLHVLFDAKNCSAATRRETVHTRVLPSYTKDRSATPKRAPNDCRTSTVHHAPSVDPPRCPLPSQTFDSVPIRAMLERPLSRRHQCFRWGCSTHQSNRADDDAHPVDVGRCRFSLQDRWPLC